MNVKRMPSIHLRTHKEFQTLYRRGNRYSTPHLRLYWRRSLDQGNRWGVVVPLKCSKRATKRNRIRRIVFTQLNQWALAHPQPPIEAVVVVTTLPPAERALREELDHFLHKTTYSQKAQGVDLRAASAAQIHHL